MNDYVLRRKAGVFRDMANIGDQDVQICNKKGFISRFSKKGKQLESSSKAKTSKPSLCSSKGKEIFGSSRGTFLSRSMPGKASLQPQKKISSRIDSGLYKVSSIQDKPETSQLTPGGEIKKNSELGTKNREFKIGISMEVGSSSMAPGTSSEKNLNKKPGVATQLNLRGSSFPSTSRCPAKMTRDPTSRYSLRNLKCNSVSDIVPTSCSSSDPSLSNRKVAFKKRNSEAESSSVAEGKRVGDSSSRERHPSSGLSISIPESRRQGISTANKKKSSPTETKRPSGSSSARVSNQGMRNRTSTNGFPALDMPMSQSKAPIETNTHISSDQPSLETSNRTSSFDRPSAGGLRAMMSIGSADNNSVCSPGNHDSFRDYDIDAIEELLLEFQRFQQREMMEEQILERDSYRFLSGLNIYDQHRDMRLDIDNMSYEELLALEERMGTVSTALSEEALSKCLERCVYQPASKGGTSCGGEEGDAKCSICQEEYGAGDEVGRLPCEHRYHIQCIQEWLRLKNWCPVCKVSAEAS